MRGKRKGNISNIIYRYAFMKNAGIFIIRQRNSVKILRRPPIRI
jgi:hypothetical protein